MTRTEFDRRSAEIRSRYPELSDDGAIFAAENAAKYIDETVDPEGFLELFEASCGAFVDDGLHLA